MNLRSRDAYRDAAWDWSCLDGCFGGRIRPTDIDGAVERRGHLLFLEAKSEDGLIPTGQEILFKSLSRKPFVDVVVFFGKREPELVVNRIEVFRAGKRHVVPSASLDRLRKMVSAWFQHADTGAQGTFDWSAFLGIP